MFCEGIFTPCYHDTLLYLLLVFCLSCDSQVEITFAYVLCLPQPSSDNRQSNMALCHRVFVKKRSHFYRIDSYVLR
jgi:hypothetical protein